MAEWILSGGTCKYVSMELYLKEQSQNIDNNKTVLYWEIRGWYTTTDPNYWFSNKTNDLSVNINGSTVFSRSYTNEAQVSIGTNHPVGNKLVIASGTAPVTHNSNGKKNVAVSWSFAAHWNPAVYTWSKSQNVDLTQIPRATTPTLSKSSVAFEAAVTITTPGASDNFVHKLTYAIGSASGTIASDVVDSTSWTIPADLMKQIPNSTSGVIKITCVTYLDGTEIGQKEVNFTAKIPSSIVPTLEVTVAEAASIPSGISGYIQSRSRLRVTSTAVGQYGATIKSYTTTVEATPYTGEEITTNTISGSGTIPVKVVVTDSRGRSTTKYVNITVTAYSLPKLTAVNAYRCTGSADATADKDGAYVCVTPRGVITSLGEKNSKSCVVYYKKTKESFYSSKSLTMSDYTLDGEYIIIPMAASDGYNIYVVLQDGFDKTTYVVPTLMAGAAYVHCPKDRRGMGLGKRLEGSGLEVGWPAEFFYDLTVLGNIYGNVRLLNHVKNEIGSGKDMNNPEYLIPGMWAVRTNDTAKTVTNIPSPYAGILITYSGTGRDNTDVTASYYYARQEYIPYESIYNRYERSIYSSAAGEDFTFRAWREVAYKDTIVDMASVAEIANALKSGVDITVGDVVANDIDAAHVDASSAVTSKAGMEIFAANPYLDFHFAGSTADYTARLIENSKGVITAINSITNGSDKRLKKAVQDIPDIYLQLVEKLYPKLYRFKKADNYLNAGFIAQDVLKAERELGITKSILVRGTGKWIPDPKHPGEKMLDYYSIDYQAFSVLLAAYVLRQFIVQQEKLDEMEKKLRRRNWKGAR